MVWWTDLMPPNDEDPGGIYIFSDMSSVPATLTIEWDLPVFGTTENCNFQLTLSEDGTIRMLYKSLPEDDDIYSDYALPSIGLEDDSGEHQIDL